MAEEVREHLGTLPDALERMARRQPFDIRYVDRLRWTREEVEDADPRSAVWMRAVGPLGDDPLVHTCALTYASDMTLLDAVRIPVEPLWGPRGFDMASLDHAMWFHRPFRADEWFLYDQESPIATGGRAWRGAGSTTGRAGCWCRWCRRGCSGGWTACRGRPAAAAPQVPGSVSCSTSWRRVRMSGGAGCSLASQVGPRPLRREPAPVSGRPQRRQRTRRRAPSPDRSTWSTAGSGSGRHRETAQEAPSSSDGGESHDPP